jgi:hypothetical protein
MTYRDIPKLTKAQEERFWSRVDRTDEHGCWEWQAGKFSTGYGCFRINDGAYYATRVAYFLTNKQQPGQLNVCHNCDNPACCNPSHLFLGTHRDNVADRDQKGRQRTLAGEQHWNVKLTEHNVRVIRRLAIDRHRYGVQAELARIFGVSREAIRDILSGKKWRHVNVEAMEMVDAH